MTSNKIRTKFLEFFKAHGHTIVPSDSLVPKDDPTVLFTTAGMQQFKRQFLGQIHGFTRAASSQKCLRTDDLEHVGITPYHHTFFEMLGNFSFGDYFKKEAICWSWEFLTTVLGIPKDKLWVSVYEEDVESYGIWTNTVKIPQNRIVKLGDKSNFWPSQARTKGPNGPCGPCSEIFYDYGPDTGCGKPQCDPGCDCARFSEIWNLVFTQFNRKENSTLEPLPHKNIDTGMGLERLAAVLQGKKSNFETDLFEPLLKAIDQETKKQHLKVLADNDRYIIADHIRAIVFAISDGIIPSNKERGFVVKRLIFDTTDIILRHHAQPFSHYLVPVVIDTMKTPYPELSAKADDIIVIIKKTAEDYQKVFKTRLPELKKQLEKAKKLTRIQQAQTYGKLMFEYRDTFGLTLSTILLTMRNLKIPSQDIDAARTVYETSMKEQKERSRASSKMVGDVFVDTQLSLSKLTKTGFLGYENMRTRSSIVKLFKDKKEILSVKEGDTVTVILDQTPFYAEAGGQIGDSGFIESKTGTIKVEDTQQISDVYLHSGIVEKGMINTGQTVKAHIDEKRRLSIMRNHTATHLLQAGLRKILGTYVQQQGSLVRDDRLRFDFTHPQALTRNQLRDIEKYINEGIFSCIPVNKKTLSIQEARKTGALAFFAEKYGETVRVVSINGYSKEFCGGTHLDNTGKIGVFKIIDESAIAQGIRRIEAITGMAAINYIHTEEQSLEKMTELLKAPQTELIRRIEIQIKRLKEDEKELEKLRFELIKNSFDDILKNSEMINQTKLISHIFKKIPTNHLRKISDLLRQKTKSSVVILGSQGTDNAILLISITDDLVRKGIQANDLIQDAALLMNGSGGGRPSMAQAGSKEVSLLDKAIKKVLQLTKDKLVL